MNRAQRKRARLTDKIISTTYHAVLQVLQALDLEEPLPFPLLETGFADDTGDYTLVVETYDGMSCSSYSVICYYN